MKTIILLLLMLLPTMAMNRAFTKITKIEAINLSVEERIVKVLRDSGYSRQMQRIILAQAKNESACFKSLLSVRHNNIFGMMHPGRKTLTFSLGGHGYAEGRYGYAVYSSIDSAVADYIQYRKRMSIPSSDDPTTYILALKKKGYFTSDVKEYIRNVRFWMRRDTSVHNFSSN